MQKRLYKFLFSLFIILAIQSLDAQNVDLGIKFQKTQTLYWENGISAQLSFDNFKPRQFYVGADYITSRLGTAINSNALKQDNLTVSIMYYLRKDRDLQFFTKLNAGLFKVSLEDDIFNDLPNSSFLLSPELGFRYNLKNQPFAINLGTGAHLNFKESGQSPGTLQLLFYNLAVYYKFQNNNNDE